MMKKKHGRQYLRDYLYNHPLQKFMLRRDDCKILIEIVVEAISKAIIKGEDVGVDGLGRFKVNEYIPPNKKVRNFKTGEFFYLETPVRSVKFEPSATMKNKMKEEMRRKMLEASCAD